MVVFLHFKKGVGPREKYFLTNPANGRTISHTRLFFIPQGENKVKSEMEEI